MRLNIPHYKIFKNAIKNFTQYVAYFPIKQIVFLLWFSYQRSFFVCFLSNVPMHTCVHSHWLCFETKNDVLKKTKLPKLYICLKLAIKTPRELLKVVQSENMQCCFCAPINNLEQVPQIILPCLLLPLSIICIWNIPFILALFL